MRAKNIFGNLPRAFELIRGLSIASNGLRDDDQALLFPQPDDPQLVHNNAELFSCVFVNMHWLFDTRGAWFEGDKPHEKISQY